MKGLIIKDIFALKKQAKILLALLIFYIVYAVAFEAWGMLVGVIVLLCIMLPVTTLAYDEKSKWDKYALSMPITRETIVLSKYIFAVLAELIGVAIVGVIGVLAVLFTGEMELKEMLLIILGTCEIGLIFLAVILPILFKFGVEKARLIMLLVIFIPTMLMVMGSQMGIAPPSAQTLKLLAYLSPLIALGGLWLSVKVSIGIYNKKEF